MNLDQKISLATKLAILLSMGPDDERQEPRLCFDFGQDESQRFVRMQRVFNGVKLVIAESDSFASYDAAIDDLIARLKAAGRARANELVRLCA